MVKNLKTFRKERIIKFLQNIRLEVIQKFKKQGFYDPKFLF